MAKIILITHQKGGVGKSTLTFNLAQNLCESSKVAILDMDVQGSLAQLQNTTKQFTITTAKEILESKNGYELILVDTPPYLSSDLPYLIRKADLIVVPTKAGILDVLAIENTIDLIKNENKQNSTLIAFNMIKPNTTLTRDILETVKPFGVKVANTRISDLVAFTRSVVLQGVQKDGNAQRQIDSLTKEVLTLLIHK